MSRVHSLRSGVSAQGLLRDCVGSQWSGSCFLLWVTHGAPGCGGEETAWPGHAAVIPSLCHEKLVPSCRLILAAVFLCSLPERAAVLLRRPARCMFPGCPGVCSLPAVAPTAWGPRLAECRGGQGAGKAPRSGGRKCLHNHQDFFY